MAFNGDAVRYIPDIFRYDCQDLLGLDRRVRASQFEHGAALHIHDLDPDAPFDNIDKYLIFNEF